ncbi:MAG: permease [Spirochaetae bacterium HGW-Spirochaetae-5]|nr:MAG: permease [Spirochaetae bacterium HGW-Spirochaetae-5]
MNSIIITLIGLTGGIFSGLLGIGGAVVMIPALIFIAGFNQLQAQGTTAGFNQLQAQGTTLFAMIPPIGILAAFEYYKAGHVEIKTAAFIAAGFIIGAWFGSKIAISINPVILKKVFGFLLLYISIKMILN